MSQRLSGLPNVTPVGNVGAGEDNLMGYTIPAGLMSRDGDRIEFTYAVNMPGLDVVLRFYINGSQVGGSDASATNSRKTFVRLSSTTGIVFLYDLYTFSIVELTDLDFTENIVVQFTGQSQWEPPSDDDIVQTYLGGEFYPADETTPAPRGPSSKADWTDPDWI